MNRSPTSASCRKMTNVLYSNLLYIGIIVAIIVGCVNSQSGTLVNFPHARDIIPARANLIARIGNEDIKILDESPQSFIERTGSSLVDTDAPFGETLHLKVDSDEISVDQVLDLDRSMFNENTKVYFNNQPDEYFAPYTSYRKEYTDKDGNHITIMASVVEEVSGKFHSINGVLTKNDETYTIMSAGQYALGIEGGINQQQQQMEEARDSTSRTKAMKVIEGLTKHLNEVDKIRQISPQNMIIYKLSSYQVTDENGNPMLQCGIGKETGGTAAAAQPVSPVTSLMVEGTPRLRRWTCPRFPPGDQPKIKMNLLVDYGAAQFLSGGRDRPAADLVLAGISDLGSKANAVFRQQLGLEVVFEKIHIATNKMAYPWAYGKRGERGSRCPSSAEEVLYGVSRWHSSRPEREKAGLTHQLTACMTVPGVVGIAYIGRVCDRTHGAGMTHVYNNYWITFAHEVGHNLGAGHPFGETLSLAGRYGGIMDYNTQGRLPANDPDSPGLIGFNRRTDQRGICTHIEQAYYHQGRDRVPLDQCWIKKPETMAT